MTRPQAAVKVPQDDLLRGKTVGVSKAGRRDRRMVRSRRLASTLPAVGAPRQVGGKVSVFLRQIICAFVRAWGAWGYDALGGSPMGCWWDALDFEGDQC